MYFPANPVPEHVNPDRVHKAWPVSAPPAQIPQPINHYVRVSRSQGQLPSRKHETC
ncbi:hypothetical protein BO71DRAFT_146025 [Aspergillus ellipticus CBS 707.79]|uniref:Uncharacterized protein n=1 Tax=Aspergillus ellipticus CBS 707.79 TaxID=1448320 RepID=A0A319DI08_9EURO|nr:hypothetical protein BO71DRAFT_146025 [Aspergillus ellipticus CBS 707.79]